MAHLPSEKSILSNFSSPRGVAILAVNLTAKQARLIISPNMRFQQRNSFVNSPFNSYCPTAVLNFLLTHSILIIIEEYSNGSLISDLPSLQEQVSRWFSATDVVRTKLLAIAHRPTLPRRALSSCHQEDSVLMTLQNC